ncbi:hypothetical protein ASG60_18435 [Methylobacterium sp. Leaf469]|uniref:hypothetical protein n=1 Tax=Methylobacterium sp. Leaf469 TaxID=1736387 RepID=UPI0006F3F48D|nr:hypothetical protein [Methylobacterium sp. Leaf469]KQU01828.1 hypothetical protein ASG60_18435 [Methylobacterium sp. Leaf469]
MSEGMFIVRDDGTLVPMRASPFESEAVFQTLLAAHPSLLAAEAVDPGNPRRWLLVAREQGVPGEEGGAGRWSLDHLFVDQDGVPTLVEVKRASDTRGRREVVAQMLDYAANGVVYWPAEMLRSQFERAYAADGRDPDDAVRALLASPEADPDAFWAGVDVNLRAGRIRMVFVADVIHPELKRIVEFLNAQMSPAEVIALELRHYVGEGLRTLVPSILGRTAEAERRKGIAGGARSASTQPTVAEWFARFEAERGSEELAIAAAIRDWWKARGATIGTTRSQRPSLYAQIAHGGHEGYPVFIKASGRVTTGLYASTKLAPYGQEDARRAVVADLAAATGLTFSDRAHDGEPSVPLALLKESTRRETLFAVWDTLLTRVRAAG